MKTLQSASYKLVTSTLIALVFTLIYAQAVSAQTASAINPPTVPNNLKAPSGERPFLKALAKGVQIYTCSASTTNSGGFEWVFKAPQADLFNEQGGTIGKHYAGPTWEAADGSKVVGEVKEKADAPNGVKAIPWLLLKAKSTAGNGLFSNVTSVQRVDTAAGLAPAAADCNQSKKDTEAQVGYTAAYYFYSTANIPAQVPSTGEGSSQESDKSGFTVLIGFVVAMLASSLYLLGSRLGKNNSKN